MLIAARLEAGSIIDAGGQRTYYREAGAGETVGFIPGWGPDVTSWANWRGACGPLHAAGFPVPEVFVTVQMITGGKPDPEAPSRGGELRS